MAARELREQQILSVDLEEKYKRIFPLLTQRQNKNVLSIKGGCVVVCDGVHKTYLLGIEGDPALRGVSLKVREGELLMIYGTSGSKSTLLNVRVRVVKRVRVLAGRSFSFAFGKDHKRKETLTENRKRVGRNA